MRKLLIVLFGLTVVLYACDDTTMEERVDYDRTGFLENTIDNLILPSFQDFATKVEVLNTNFIAFESEPSEANLQMLRSSLKDSWLSFQYVAYLEVGPSAEVFFREELNIFPADTISIESKIADQDYSLSGASNIDTKGFPAVDYLINGTANSDAEIIAYFTDNNSGTDRMTYLSTLIGEIHRIAQTVNNGWSSYRATFLEEKGTDIGSSTGKLVNELNKQFDLRLKNGKIGIPSGVKSLERPNPGKVECFHGKYSKELALASANAALNIFKGIHFNGSTDGEGLDDYLDALNATNNGEKLSVLITESMQESIRKVETIEPDLETAAQTFQEDAPLVQSYYAMQAVIPLIKVDMTSAMGVTISFQDNDGD